MLLQHGNAIACPCLGCTRSFDRIITKVIVVREGEELLIIAMPSIRTAGIRSQQRFAVHHQEYLWRLADLDLHLAPDIYATAFGFGEPEPTQTCASMSPRTGFARRPAMINGSAAVLIFNQMIHDRGLAFSDHQLEILVSLSCICDFNVWTETPWQSCLRNFLGE